MKRKVGRPRLPVNEKKLNFTVRFSKKERKRIADFIRTMPVVEGKTPGELVHAITIGFLNWADVGKETRKVLDAV